MTTVQNLKSDVEQLKSETQTIKDGAVGEINTAKTDATTSITQSKDAALTEIGSATASAIGGVNTAKVAGVNAINTAKTESLNAMTPLKEAAEDAAALATQKATTATDKALEAAGSATTAGEKAIAATNAADRAETAAASAEQVTQASLKKDQNLADLSNKLVARTNLSLDRILQAPTYTYMQSPAGSKIVIVDGGKVEFQNDSANTIGLPITSGGTGATTLSGARNNLLVQGIDCKTSTMAGDYNSFTSPNGAYSLRIAGDGGWSYVKNDDNSASPLSVGGGGTGAQTTANARKNLGLDGFETVNNESRIYGPADRHAFFRVTQQADDWGVWDENNSRPIPLAIAFGGTGATDVEGARTNLGVGANQSPSFHALTVTGKDYSFTVKGGESNDVRIYAATKPPLDDWANFTSYSWYNDYSISGAIRGGSDKIKCHRLRVYSPGVDSTDFDFVPQGEIYANRGATVYVYSKNPTSDRDLKSEIIYTEGRESYDRVMQWLPTMFKYKGSNIQRYGLIAQDLAKIDLQYVKIVPGSPIFEDVIGINEEGEDYVDHQIETGVADDTLSLDSNVILTDMACAVVYMGSQLEQQRKELDELKKLVSELITPDNS
ncbi:tail fiber domain-containing protein [Salmonella enterica subsp. enterica serovar Hadar]|nr:tail fiber domain-containing protein [Salmonella enterica subsp. enterica serovar Hadar]